MDTKTLLALKILRVMMLAEYEPHNRSWGLCGNYEAMMDKMYLEAREWGIPKGRLDELAENLRDSRAELMRVIHHYCWLTETAVCYPIEGSQAAYWDNPDKWDEVWRPVRIAFILGLIEYLNNRDEEALKNLELPAPWQK